LEIHLTTLALCIGHTIYEALLDGRLIPCTLLDSRVGNLTRLDWKFEVSYRYPNQISKEPVNFQHLKSSRGFFYFVSCRRLTKCPQTGFWTGETSDSRNASVVGAHSPLQASWYRRCSTWLQLRRYETKAIPGSKWPWIAIRQGCCSLVWTSMYLSLFADWFIRSGLVAQSCLNGHFLQWSKARSFLLSFFRVQNVINSIKSTERTQEGPFEQSVRSRDTGVGPMWFEASGNNRGQPFCSIRRYSSRRGIEARG
jgi:hypothetical protein